MPRPGWDDRVTVSEGSAGGRWRHAPDPSRHPLPDAFAPRADPRDRHRFGGGRPGCRRPIEPTGHRRDDRCRDDPCRRPGSDRRGPRGRIPRRRRIANHLGGARGHRRSTRHTSGPEPSCAATGGQIGGQVRRGHRGQRSVPGAGTTSGSRRSASTSRCRPIACSNKSYPGNRVYRWGCAGKNNVYLFGHAHSVFKPLHDAYVRAGSGRARSCTTPTRVGVSGRSRSAWWKVTTPTKGAWAYAPLTSPSLTLQTCVGAKSQYRLIVRLTQVG